MYKTKWTEIDLGGIMRLAEATPGQEYMITNVCTEDDEMNAFLFSLGCYSGEPITVVSKKRSGLVVSIKDGKYNIDHYLSNAIEV